jgi:cation transport regulator ChaC
MKRFLVVGYGSLEDHNSLRETISDKNFKLVIVKGYKRIFNLSDSNSHKRDVLNLSKNSKSQFNGVMFPASEKEILKLKKRELEYNLEETLAYDFETKKKIGNCLVFVDGLISLDDKNRLPDKKYFLLCRNASYSLGKKFGEIKYFC